MKKIKYYILLLVISGCYSLNSVEDIDKYVSYVNNRKDTIQKSKEFETPNSDRKTFGITKISELHNQHSDIVRVIVNIDLKELSATYKFYYEYDNLVYSEIVESSPDKNTSEKIKKIDDVYYFKDGESIKSISNIEKSTDENRALILSKFYFIENF
ncbi:hypothetical protein SAMN04489722_1273 [Algibacter lectus]|uniref:hypothetical protein n=1 Tax=Algibacter lectus TaxID=221126 RepID=UPI0008F33D0E|nr:hypothetical protein [Algibacter lectus]SFD74532.1 hypothetical protein SAMN04489722_1273 [Algibacter lectus]